MYQQKAQHPLSELSNNLDPASEEAVWVLFCHIGTYWRNLQHPEAYRSRVRSFVANRIALNPLYRSYYSTAKEVMDELVGEHGEERAYELLFTDADANQAPPVSRLAIVRQYVSNELVALQIALGGFAAFGALNYPGYICGPNIDGKPAPYRTFKVQP